MEPQVRTTLKCLLKITLRLSRNIKQTGGLHNEGAHAFTKANDRPGLVSSRQVRECTIRIPPARGGGNRARGAHSRSSTAGFTKIRGSSTLLHRSLLAQCATAPLPDTWYCTAAPARLQPPKTSPLGHRRSNAPSESRPLSQSPILRMSGSLNATH